MYQYILLIITHDIYWEELFELKETTCSEHVLISIFYDVCTL